MAKEPRKYVKCFQVFPALGLTAVPFEARVLGEEGDFWLIKPRRVKQRVHAPKSTCSVVPYTQQELGTVAYHNKVAQYANIWPAPADLEEDEDEEDDALPAKRPIRRKQL